MQAYGRALELDAGRLYSRVQCGSIRLTLGDYAEGLRDFDRYGAGVPVTHKQGSFLKLCVVNCGNLVAAAPAAVCLTAVGT